MSRGRRMLEKLALGVASTLLLAGCTGSLPGPATSAPSANLTSRLNAILAEPPFDRVQWGILVTDPGNGRTLYDRGSDLLFIPGSNAKLPVVAAALDRLGGTFRWETSVYARVRPSAGVIDGPLFLVGRGDPTLGPPFYDSGTAALAALVDSLVAIGIERVSERVFVDVSAWDSTSIPDSWMVEDLPGAAGATGGAFAVSRGELEIRVFGGGRAGEAAAVEWEPAGLGTGPPFVESAVATTGPDTDTGLAALYRPESRRWQLEGTLAVGETETLRRAARDPVRLAAASFHQALVDRGIDVEGVDVLWNPGVAVDGRCVSGGLPSCPGMLRLAGIASPPLSVVAAEILAPSQNWMADQLLRTLGAEAEGRGSWSTGLEAVADFLTGRVGLSDADFHLEDGSGLSNHSLLSPRALIRLLEHAARQPWGEVFRASLARPGREDSTLENRLGGLEDRVAAKTGSLSHVNSLSGYLETDDGRTLAFSILSNGANLPSSQVREGIDRLVRELARP